MFAVVGEERKTNGRLLDYVRQSGTEDEVVCFEDCPTSMEEEHDTVFGGVEVDGKMQIF